MYLLAAGTGITPMLGLLKFMLTRSNPRCESVHLMFFNKTEEDILFRKKLEEIAEQDSRLHTTHILSNASSSWSGLKGRISTEILTEALGKVDLTAEVGTHFVCLCGPTEFTHTGLDLLKKLGVDESYMHAFIG